MQRGVWRRFDSNPPPRSTDARNRTTLLCERTDSMKLTIDREKKGRRRVGGRYFVRSNYFEVCKTDAHDLHEGND